MRCLALAQAWKDVGGKSVFMTDIESPAVTARLRSEGIDIASLNAHPGSLDDARNTAFLAHEIGSKWVVVDGYHFGSCYQKIIKDSGMNLLFIDDNGHADHYHADIVLNQNIHANEKIYRSREPYTRLLLGTRYAMLRKEFLRWKGWKRDIRDVARKVLVTLGGSDPNNVTLKAIQALQQQDMERLETIVISGTSNPHCNDLISAIKNHNYRINLESNVQNMPRLMAWADIAIAAGGTTSWELAFMGLPSCIIIIAKNQCEIARQLDERRIAVSLGWHEKVSSYCIAKRLRGLINSKETRTSMIKRGQNTVDGNGVFRVIAALNNNLGGFDAYPLYGK